MKPLTDRGKGMPSLLSRMPIVPTPRPCDGCNLLQNCLCRDIDWRELSNTRDTKLVIQFVERCRSNENVDGDSERHIEVTEAGH